MECKVVYVDGLDTDWRVVGYRVVDYKRYKENEEEIWKNYNSQKKNGKSLN